MAGAASPPPFVMDGLCGQADPEAFYPEPGSSSVEAKKVCRHCPVRVECLRWALETREQWGVWGGLSARERRRLLSGARAAA